MADNNSDIDAQTKSERKEAEESVVNESTGNMILRKFRIFKGIKKKVPKDNLDSFAKRVTDGRVGMIDVLNDPVVTDVAQNIRSLSPMQYRGIFVAAESGNYEKAAKLLLNAIELDENLRLSEFRRVFTAYTGIRDPLQQKFQHEEAVEDGLIDKENSVWDLRGNKTSAILNARAIEPQPKSAQIETWLASTANSVPDPTLLDDHAYLDSLLKMKPANVISEEKKSFEPNSNVAFQGMKLRPTTANVTNQVNIVNNDTNAFLNVLHKRHDDDIINNNNNNNNNNNINNNNNNSSSNSSNDAGEDEDTPILIDAEQQIFQACFNGDEALLKQTCTALGPSCKNVTLGDGHTPLHVAAAAGRYNVIRYLVYEAGLNIDAQTKDGMTPLYIASQEGFTNIVEYLLLAGAKNDICSSDGINPIWIAAHEGHAEVISLLLRNGANVDTTDIVGFTPLFIASQHGHLEAIKILVEQGRATIDSRTNNGATPLYIASANGHLQLVKYLCEHDANPLLAKEGGMTPIHIAAVKGHPEVLQYLVEYSNASAKRTDAQHHAFLAKSKLKKTEGGVIMNNEASKRENNHLLDSNDLALTGSLCIAAFKGQTQVAEYLIKNLGVDPNTSTEKGLMPVVCAAAHSHIETLKKLLECGASVSRLSSDQLAELLTCATKAGDNQLLKQFISRSRYSPLNSDAVNINCKDHIGLTPTQWAQECHQYETLSLLISQGADIYPGNYLPNRRNLSAGNTYLHTLIWNNKEPNDVFFNPHEWNTDINSQNSEFGRTPLHHACFIGNFDWVRKLIHPDREQERHAASPNIADDLGFTPLHEACQSGHYEIIEFLLKDGLCRESVTKVTYENGLLPEELIPSHHPQRKELVRILRNAGSSKIKNSFRKFKSFCFTVFSAVLMIVFLPAGIFAQALTCFSSQRINRRRISSLIFTNGNVSYFKLFIGFAMMCIFYLFPIIYLIPSSLHSKDDLEHNGGEGMFTYGVCLISFLTGFLLLMLSLAADEVRSWNGIKPSLSLSKANFEVSGVSSLKDVARQMRATPSIGDMFLASSTNFKSSAGAGAGAGAITLAADNLVTVPSRFNVGIGTSPNSLVGLYPTKEILGFDIRYLTYFKFLIELFQLTAFIFLPEKVEEGLQSSTQKFFDGTRFDFQPGARSWHASFGIVFVLLGIWFIYTLPIGLTYWMRHPQFEYTIRRRFGFEFMRNDIWMALPYTNLVIYIIGDVFFTTIVAVLVRSFSCYRNTLPHYFYPEHHVLCDSSNQHKAYVITSSIALVYYVITSIPFSLYSMDTMMTSKKSKIGHTSVYEVMYRSIVFVIAAFAELLHVTDPLFIIWLGCWGSGTLAYTRIKWQPDSGENKGHPSLNTVGSVFYLCQISSAAAAWAAYSNKHKWAPEIILIVGWCATVFLAGITLRRKKQDAKHLVHPITPIDNNV